MLAALGDRIELGSPALLGSVTYDRLHLSNIAELSEL
jgi:hypothetical protein